MFKAKTVIKNITFPSSATLELVKGEGYWYFIYDDVTNNRYETHSVWTMYLNSLSLERWIEIGQDFADKATQGDIR